MSSIFDDRINQVVGYRTLHGFAVGLVSIFIPIFIAQEGFPPETVFSFLFVQLLVFTLSAVPIGWLTSRLGVRNVFLGSSIFYVLVFLVLRAFTLEPLVIYSAAAVMGVALAMHWIPVNLEFTEGSEVENRGSSWGQIEGIPQIVGPFAPLLGGFILDYLGFSFLVTISLMLASISVLPMVLGRSFGKPEFEIGEHLSPRKDIDLWLLYFFDGFSTAVYAWIFPLFIFFSVGGVIDVGAVQALAGIAGGLFSLGAGRLSDRFDKARLVFAGVILAAAVFVFVPGLEDRWVAFVVSFLLGLVYMFHVIPLASIIADIADQRSVLGFYSVREIFRGMGYVSLVGATVLLISAYSLEKAFLVAFYAGATTFIAVGILVSLVDSRR